LNSNLADLPISFDSVILSLLGKPVRLTIPLSSRVDSCAVLLNLHERYGGDPAWITTVDTLRVPPEDGVKGYIWPLENALLAEGTVLAFQVVGVAD
jgi:hypothetical protein